MRFATLVAVLAALTACMPEEEAAPVQEADACGAAALQARVGTPVEDHAFGGDTRIIPPGTAVTMDFRDDRLNVETDEDGVITRIYCG